jgi:WD40 repeat protein
MFMVLDTTTSEPIAQLDATRRDLSPRSRFWYAAAAVSSDGKTIAGSISDDWGQAEITIWNGTNYKVITNFVAHLSRVYSIAFSPRGDLLATGGSRDSSVRLWDWNSPAEPAKHPLIDRANATLRPRHVLRDHKHHVRDVRFSPGGMLLASVSESFGKGQLIIWAMKDLTQPMFEWSGAGLYSVAFSPDGKSIATGDHRGNVRIWRLTRSRPKSPQGP